MRTFLCALMLCLLCSASAWAEQVTIMTGEWPPYVSENMENNGFTAEIVSHAMLAADLEPAFSFMPWKRCARNVESGEGLAAFPYAVTAEREEYASFSEPIAKTRNVFFYIKSNLGSFDFVDLTELKGKAVGGVAGNFYETTFKNVSLNVDYATNEESAFKKLYMGRVDLVPASELVGWELIKKLYPGEEQKFGSTVTSFKDNTLHLMVSKKYPNSQAMLEDFNKGLQDIKEKGIYAKILAKYNVSE